MPDITMCMGEGCPVKNHCYRHIAKPSDYQSYFVESPWDGEKCEMLWSDNANQILDKLKNIMNNESTSNNSDNGLHGI